MNDLQVTRLCDLSNDANSVTSVSWSERGNQVAVGTHHGYVTVWDVAVNKQVSKVNKKLPGRKMLFHCFVRSLE